MTLSNFNTRVICRLFVGTGIFFSTTAFASTFLQMSAPGVTQNLPSLNGYKLIGRLPLFESVHPIQWFVPFAFSQTLSCSPLGTPKRSCELRIMNFFSPSELSGLAKFSSSGSSGAAAVTPLNSRVVSEIAESFVLDPLSSQIQFSQSTLQTLVLSQNVPYAVISYRGPADDIRMLEKKFEREGLGKFISNVILNSENVNSYLSIVNVDLLISELATLRDHLFSEDELNSALEHLSQLAQIESQKVSLNESQTLIKWALRRRLFVVDDDANYHLSDIALTKLESPIELINETSGVRQVSCSAEIELKSDVPPHVACGRK